MHEYRHHYGTRDVNIAIVDIASLLIFIVVFQTSIGRL